MMPTEALLFDPPEPEPVRRPSLATLHGSERQIRWAQEIREEMIPEMIRILDDYTRLREAYLLAGKLPRAQQAWTDRQLLLGGLQTACRQMACSWWIDRRDNTAREILEGMKPKPGPSWGREGDPNE